MATYTTNYNLTKPDTTDAIDIAVLNDNFDTIDTTLADKEDALTFDDTPTENSTNPITSGGVYTALQELTPVALGSLSLTTTWTDEGEGVYSQEVTIDDVTTASKIDLQPDATVLAQMINNQVIALGAVNDSGTVTVYAYGNAPTVALTVQYTRMEVTS